TKPCGRRIATSTFCATHHLSIHSIRAAYISAPPAGRCTGRPMAAIAGRPSSATSQPCIPSKRRLCSKKDIVVQSKANTVDQYLRALPPDRRDAINAVRKVILKNLPDAFEEVMQYGMISYVVPFKLFPAGYHCDPSQP